jgi:photosystem II stability/assembly factor-like uncharacterized protein
MVVQLPPDREAAPPPLDVEAGVIDDARARHRRERWGAAAIAAVGLGIGLLFGLGGGGGGPSTRHQARSGGAPGASGQRSLRPLAMIARPQHVTEFGLLAPGVGWAINDGGFYLTRDGGRSWGVLAGAANTASANKAVPGFGLAGDLTVQTGASSSPSPNVLALSFLNTRIRPSCANRLFPATGELVLSADTGRTWATHVLPGCHFATSLSFVDSRLGYAVLAPTAHDSELLRTTDSGVRWTRVSRFPEPMTVSFGSLDDGLAFVTPNTKSAAGLLYRTTDGGRSWQRSRICGDTPDPTFTVYCGMPVSFGSRGVVLAVSRNLAKAHGDSAYLYTTADAGSAWSRHALPALNSPQMPAFSAPSASDLFVYSMNGVLHTSIDGGRSWSAIRQPALRDMQQMQFVSATYGWVLADGRFDYTTDGGRSWLPLGGG